MNKQETLARLGISERTLTNYVAAGRLNVRYEKGKTRPVANYDPEEVDNLAKELEKQANPAKPAVIVNSGKQANLESSNQDSNLAKQTSTLARLGAAPLPDSKQAEQGTTFAEVLTASLKEVAAMEPNNLAAKLLLTIPEAIAYSGLKEKPIRNAIKSGALPSIREGRSIQVRPSDLQKWVNGKFKS